MTPLAQALSTALLHFIWQGIAVGVLLWIALFLLRKRSANARYAVNCLALAVLATAPLLTMGLLYSPASAVQVAAAPAGGAVAVDSVVATPAGPSPWISWYTSIEAWALPAWAIGVLLFALRLAWSCGHASALRREGAAAEPWILSMVHAAAERLGVRGPVRVLMSSIAEVPSVVGWIRPVILLPASAITGLTPQQLEAVIAHELAHIRRHDYLVNLLQSLVETLLFYHPVVWWTSANIRRERELCCDDLAVRCCGDAVCYARALTNLEKLRLWKPGLAMNSARGPLFGRIQRVLTRQEGEYGPSRLVCAAGLVAGMICLALNMSWAQERQDRTNNASEGLRMILPPPQSVIPPEPPSPPAPPVTPAASAAVAPAPPSAAVAPVPPPVPFPPGTSTPWAAVVPPAPPAPPVPVPPGTRYAMAEALFQVDSVPWALFRGNREMLSGSDEDQAEARAARAAAGGGDLLWFRLDGKAYVSTDAETMARIEGLREESAESQRALAEQLLSVDNAVLELRGVTERLTITAELQKDIGRLQAGVQQLQSNFSQAQLQLIQAQIVALQAKVAQSQRDQVSLRLQQTELNARARELERAANLLERQSRRSQMLDLLREAVNSGRARPVQ
jgi:beta-lactamase regulating signal transducer with metallopeptidase domain